MSSTSYLNNSTSNYYRQNIQANPPASPFFASNNNNNNNNNNNISRMQNNQTPPPPPVSTQHHLFHHHPQQQQQNNYSNNSSLFYQQPASPSTITTTGHHNNNNNNNTPNNNAVPLSGKALEHWLSLQRRATHQTPTRHMTPNQQNSNANAQRTGSPSPSPRNPRQLAKNNPNLENNSDNNSNIDDSAAFQQLQQQHQQNNNGSNSGGNLPAHLSPASNMPPAVLLSAGREKDWAKLRQEFLERHQELQDDEEKQRLDIMKEAATKFSFVDLIFAISCLRRTEALLGNVIATSSSNNHNINNDSQQHNSSSSHVPSLFLSISPTYEPSPPETPLTVAFILRRVMQMISELGDVKRATTAVAATVDASAQADTTSHPHKHTELQLVEENSRLRSQLDFVLNAKLASSTAFFRVLTQQYQAELDEAAEVLEKTMQELEDESRMRMELEMEHLAAAKKSAHAAKLADEATKALEQEKLSADAERRARADAEAKLDEANAEVDAQTMSKAQLATLAARERMNARPTQFVSSDKSTQTQLGLTSVGGILRPFSRSGSSASATGGGSHNSQIINNSNSNNNNPTSASLLALTRKNTNASVISAGSNTSADNNNNHQQQKHHNPHSLNSLIAVPTNNGPRNPKDCGELVLDTTSVPGANEVSLFAAEAQCFMRGGYEYKKGAVEIDMLKGVIQHFSDYTSVVLFRHGMSVENSDVVAAIASNNNNNNAGNSTPRKRANSGNENTTTVANSEQNSPMSSKSQQQQQQPQEPQANVSIKISTVAAVERFELFPSTFSNSNNNNNNSFKSKKENTLRLILTQDHSHVDLVMSNRRDCECVFEALALARSTFISRCFIKKSWGDNASLGNNKNNSNNLLLLGEDINIANNVSSKNNTNAQTRTNPMELDYRVKILVPISKSHIGNLFESSAIMTSNSQLMIRNNNNNSNNNDESNLRKMDSLALIQQQNITLSSPTNLGGGAGSSSFIGNATTNNFASATFTPDMNSQTSLSHGSGSLFFTLQRMHRCRIAWVSVDDVMSGVVSEGELRDLSVNSNLLVLWRQQEHRENQKPPLLTTFLNFGGFGGTNNNANNSNSNENQNSAKTQNFASTSAATTTSVFPPSLLPAVDFSKWSVVVSASSTSEIENDKSSVSQLNNNNNKYSSLLVTTTQLLIASSRESLSWIGSYQTAHQPFCSQLSISLFLLGSKLTFVSCDVSGWFFKNSSNNNSNTNYSSTKLLQLVQNEIFSSGSDSVFVLCAKKDIELLQDNATEMILSSSLNSAAAMPLSFSIIPNDDFDDEEDDDDDEDNAKNENLINVDNNNNNNEYDDDGIFDSTLTILQKRKDEQVNKNGGKKRNSANNREKPTLGIVMCSHSFLPGFSGSTIWRPVSTRDPSASELADGVIRRLPHSTLVPVRRIPCTILGQPRDEANHAGEASIYSSFIRIKNVRVNLAMNSSSSSQINKTLECFLASPCLGDNENNTASAFSLVQQQQQSATSLQLLFSLLLQKTSRASSSQGSSTVRVPLLTNDKTRIASEVITFKAVDCTKLEEKILQRKKKLEEEEQEQQQQNLNNNNNNREMVAKTTREEREQEEQRQIVASCTITGHFSILSSQGWIPGSGEVARCRFRLFSENNNNNNNSEEEKQNGSNEEDHYHEDEIGLKNFVYVGDCEIDLSMS